MQYNLLSTENLGFYRICNPNARSARHVLILKDSMEDPMTDYWAELFSEIIVIDPRSYLREESLPELVAEYDSIWRCSCITRTISARSSSIF